MANVVNIKYRYFYFTSTISLLNFLYLTFSFFNNEEELQEDIDDNGAWHMKSTQNIDDGTITIFFKIGSC